MSGALRRYGSGGALRPPSAGSGGGGGGVQRVTAGDGISLGGTLQVPQVAVALAASEPGLEFDGGGLKLIPPAGGGGTITRRATITRLWNGGGAGVQFRTSAGDGTTDLMLDIREGSNRYQWDEFDEIVLVLLGSATDSRPARAYYPLAAFANTSDRIGAFLFGNRGIQRRGASSFRTYTGDGPWGNRYLDAIEGVAYTWTFTPA